MTRGCGHAETRPIRILFFALLLIALARLASANEEYSFDLGEFEKKAVEWGGYAELAYEHLDLKTDGALTHLEHYRQPRSDLDRYRGTLQLDGRYHRDALSADWLIRTAAQKDALEEESSIDLFEGYLSFEPAPAATLRLGKKAFKWGKGYAWNPVGVIDRPKDPNNPEEALEGYAGLEVEVARSFSGALQTLALTGVMLPATRDINTDFGDTGNNLAAKLYLLVHDTDIDLVWFDGDSRPTKYGIDFAKNLATNFEIHGELLHIPGQGKKVLASNGVIEGRKTADTRYLLGLRYLTPSDLTTIVEFYHNDSGYSQAQLDRFYQFVEAADTAFTATGDPSGIDKAQMLAKAGYARPQAGQNYLYIKASQKDPFDLLYTTPALTAIVNLDDRSFSVSPEITYTGFTNWEGRMRLTLLQGADSDEYGEKPNDWKLEFRVRRYF